jgi:hypothetical protein
VLRKKAGCDRARKGLVGLALLVEFIQLGMSTGNSSNRSCFNRFIESLLFALYLSSWNPPQSTPSVCPLGGVTQIEESTAAVKYEVSLLD